MSQDNKTDPLPSEVSPPSGPDPRFRDPGKDLTDDALIRPQPWVPKDFFLYIQSIVPGRSTFTIVVNLLLKRLIHESKRIGISTYHDRGRFERLVTGGYIPGLPVESVQPGPVVPSEPLEAGTTGVRNPTPVHPGRSTPAEPINRTGDKTRRSNVRRGKKNLRKKVA